MRVYRVDETSATGVKAIFDIMEATYTGQDMGKRSVTATIKWPTPIDFHIGDYIEIPMQSLRRGEEKRGIIYEKFYIYHEPQCKKSARPMSTGDAFEHTVTFYPRQYELAGVQMRDFLQQNGEGTPIVYTGFDSVSFYGGAHELLERCMACLAQQFVDGEGHPLWSYELADSVNEDKNNALDRYAFSFKGQSVMDALMKLNDKDGINTTFFINDRKIYVGFKRPYLCKVNSAGQIEDKPLKMMYGKTSDKPIDLDHGGLYDITKTVGEELPITKLYAYGAARNLNRYYCSDRIQSGRFVNKLMLPSFSDDGQTDYIISEDGARKYGIIEGSQTFDQIYPSIRYMTYADILGIKYCIKVRYSGLESDIFDNGSTMTHSNTNSSYPIARVQCYKVVPSATEGVNTLVESAPPEDLAVFIHATGKTVKVRLYGGSTNAEAIAKQIAHDVYVPTTDGQAPAQDYSNVYPGACFAVHDIGWPDMDGTTHTAAERQEWFEYDPSETVTSDRDSLLHRIEYVDTFWLTDLYAFNSYSQTSFRRDGYSAWAWPRLNSQSNYPDSLLVNEVVAVEPITIPDTSDNQSHGRQQHWDIYLRDLGFAIDEQNDFGEMVFVFATPVVSVLDGTLAGREFTIDGGDNLNNFQNRVVCAYKEDGTLNQDFYEIGDSNDESVAPRAFAQGAIWRIRLNRIDNDSELSNIGLVLPNTDIQMKKGDHVVLLDIYMPDIYVRAAEKRLLKEAQKFLDKNDKCNVKYSVSFDKVRIQQITNYALQMREGVLLRVSDEDLNMTSENAMRTLVDYAVPAQYNVPLFEMDSDTETYDSTHQYIYYGLSDAGNNEPKFSDISSIDSDAQQAGHISVSIRIPKQEGATSFGSVSIRKGFPSQTLPIDDGTLVVSDAGEWWILRFDTVRTSWETITAANEIIVQMTESVTRPVFTKDVKTSTEYVPAICQDFIDFRANKHYEISLVVDNNYWTDDDLLWRDTIKHRDIILTPSNGDALVYYRPESYTLDKEIVDDDHTRLTYKFYIPDNFNDANGYYVAVPYHGDGVSDYAIVQMESVVEKDLDEDENKVDYVDFVATNVTVKITDNTRPDETRILHSYPEAIREVQAQIAEQSKPSAWGQLMNEVQNNATTIDKMQQVYESFVQTARINYQQLLNVRDAIFDPDGSCTDLFVQTMMLQVGADSMNYQLEKTMTSATGMMSNYTVERRTGIDTYDHFRVFEQDTLHHFVYTQGTENQGSWIIPGNFDAELAPETNSDGDTVWPTYYICLRCRKDTVNDISEHAWICSTKQYAVNESDPEDPSVANYWYFNWGILIADSNGHYSITETRGNAYMYGDNLICGKISTIVGNSYFDLTHGNFVLSKETGSPALSYIDGVLTIGGINDGTENSVLNRLNLLDNIGGENISCLDGGKYIEEDVYEDNTPSNVIYGDIDLTYSYPGDYGTTVYVFEAAGNFVFSAKKIECMMWTYNGVPISGAILFIKLQAINESGYVHKEVYLENGTDISDVKIKTTVRCRFRIRVAYQPQNNAKLHLEFIDVMLQRGMKSTTYHEYVAHLNDALHGTTDIAGGLVMTNLLMLKNEEGSVVSGMSGLTDDNAEGTLGDGTFSNGVSMFAGGTYAEALAQAQGLIHYLPILLTKTGVGSNIGCLEVVTQESIAVYNENRTNRILLTSGELMSMKLQKLVSGEWIDVLIIDNSNISSQYEIFSLLRTTDCPTLKRSSDVPRDPAKYLIKFMDSNGGKVDRINIPQGCSCDISANHVIHISFNTRMSSWKLSDVALYGSVSLVEISGSTYTTIASHTINGLTAYSVRDGLADWRFNLTGFDSSPYTLTNAGNYGILLTIDKFVRTNGAGVDYEEHLYNSNWEDCSFGVSIFQNVNFSRTIAEDRVVMHIGSDGMLISHSATSYFMVKNDQSNMDIRIGGLPTQSSGAAANGLYKGSGNVICIN